MNLEEPIKKKSNTRVDLCGGTLDLWPLSVLIENSKTYNVSLSCMTEVFYQPDKKGFIVSIESPDFKESFSFKTLGELYSNSDSKMRLLQEAFKAFLKNYPSVSLQGDWSIKSESPAGSGLGGSSSLLISLIKVLSEVSGAELNEEQMVVWAKNIETRVLEKPAGVQDYYPALKPGLSCISFEPSGESRRIFSNDLLEFLNDHLLLVDSQIKHHSGQNNWEVFKKMIDGDESIKAALEELAKIANDFEEALCAKDLGKLKTLFDRELEARKKVSKLYFNEGLTQFCKKLESIDEVLSYKVCGAGGGGCVLVLHKHKKDKKSAVLEHLKKLDIKHFPFYLIGK